MKTKTETLEFEVGTGNLNIMYKWKDEYGVECYKLFRNCKLIK